MSGRAPDLTHTWAIVPLRGLETAKTRLGDELDAEERLELVVAMAERTLAGTRDARRIEGTVLVTADLAAAHLAERFGASTIVQRVAGLNEAIREARVVATTAGATAVLVVPIDLAAISAAALDEIVAAGSGAIDTSPSRPLVVVVPDRHGSGTNALLVSPPGAIEPAFGPGSRPAHASAAATADATYLELGGPLIDDVDTAEDLLALEGTARGDRHGA